MSVFSSFFRSTETATQSTVEAPKSTKVEITIHTLATSKLMRPLGAIATLPATYEGKPLDAFSDFEKWYHGEDQDAIDGSDTYTLEGKDFKFTVRRDAITSYRVEVND